MSEPVIDPMTSNPSRINRTTVATQATNDRPPSIDTHKPLVPSTLTGLAAILAPLLAGAAAFLPPPFGWIAAALALVAAYLAGQAMPQPKWAAGKPIIPLAFVPVAVGAVPVIAKLAEGLPEGLPRNGLYLVSLVLAGLAGLASPPPLTPVVPKA